MTSQSRTPKPFEMVHVFPVVDRVIPDEHWDSIRVGIEPYMTDADALPSVKAVVAKAVAAYDGMIKIGVNEGFAPKEATTQALEGFRDEALRLSEIVRAMPSEARQRLRFEIAFPHDELPIPTCGCPPTEELVTVLDSLSVYLMDLADFADLAIRRVQYEKRAGRPVKDIAADEVGVRCRHVWLKHTAERVSVLNPERGGPSKWERFLGAVLRAAGAEVSARTVTERLARSPKVR